MRDATRSDSSIPKWLLTEHQRRNQTTLELREIFDQHRQRVMHLLKRVACETAGRLCVLGAGNCNDLQLDELLNTFEKVFLVDIDQTAVASAVARLIPETLRDRIHVAESTDVTGVFDYLQSIDKNDFHATQTNHLLSLLSHQQHIPMAPFDCIASTCLLSELIDSVFLAMGGNHPALAPVILALRRQHLRMMIQSLRVGGFGLVIFDFVSSQTLPELMRIDERILNSALVDAINEKNFFTGLNPFAVQAELKTHPDFLGLVTDVRLHPPWRWDLGHKQFAVSAISFRRSL
jgi:hypothetical protein